VARVERRLTRGMTAVEAALGFAIIGSVLAVAIPVFVRDLHASHLAEATDGLGAIGRGAVAYASSYPVDEAFPPSAPLTPPRPPRGTREIDAPEVWDTPTWQALGFGFPPPPPPSPLPVTAVTARVLLAGKPHAFAFAFESALSRSRSSFVAHAHGDLDGDGILSTFEIRGHAVEGDPAGPSVDPGMYVEAPLE
jgi:hypothetical protein